MTTLFNGRVPGPDDEELARRGVLRFPAPADAKPPAVRPINPDSAVSPHPPAVVVGADDIPPMPAAAKTEVEPAIFRRMMSRAEAEAAEEAARAGKWYNRAGRATLDGGKAVGKWTIVKPVEWIVVKPVVGIWKGTKWAGRGVRDFFSGSKPYYESGVREGISGKTMLIIAGVIAGVAAIGTFFSGRKSPLGGGVDEQAEAQRQQETAMMNNLIQSVAAQNQAMYRNKGNWAKSVPQPSASYMEQNELESQQSVGGPAK